MSIFLVVLSCIVLAVWIFNLWRGLAIFRDSPSLRAGLNYSLPSSPRVAVLIPARNEAGHVGACISSLLQSHYPVDAIWVYDDRSQDGTAAEVEETARGDHRVHLVRGTEDPPPGWCGKTWALEKLYEAAKPDAELILFTDADTRHYPHGLTRAVSEILLSEADMLSLLPKNRCDTFWEKVVQPAVTALVGLYYPAGKVNASEDPGDAFANGQYILFHRQAYEKIGRHQGVKDKVLEDVELARYVRRQGFRPRLVLGEQVFETRMYASLKELFWGWSKNIFLILGSSWPRAVSVSLMITLLPLIPLIALLAGLFAGTAFSLAFGISQYLIVLAFTAVLRYLGPGYPAYAPLAPLGNLIAAAIILTSTYYHLTGKPVPWKGRLVCNGDGSINGRAKA